MNDMNPKANQQPAFAKFLGIEITHLSADKVTAELAMRADLNNRFDIMHGGERQPERRPDDDNAGEQDQFLRADPGWRHGLCRVHAAASRTHHDGLADPHHARRRPALRAGDADADGAGAEEKISDQLSAARFAGAPRLASTTPAAQTTMPAIDRASSFSPNRR